VIGILIKTYSELNSRRSRWLGEGRLGRRRKRRGRERSERFEEFFWSYSIELKAA